VAPPASGAGGGGEREGVTHCGQIAEQRSEKRDKRTPRTLRRVALGVYLVMSL